MWDLGELEKAKMPQQLHPLSPHPETTPASFFSPFAQNSWFEVIL
jgi:hypothetical protein